ncbi:MAG TPA: hypothetical protein PK625_07870, partial [Spirochaetales bacterium]|nr:hypothetical protein [Spirochaetales bacterium]
PDFERVAAERPDSDAASLVRDEVRRINRSLPQFMKIVDVIIRDEEFEKTSSRKVRRFMYRHYAEAGQGKRL